MEMLQGVWKQHLRPRAVVGYTALKFFFPVLQITSPDHLVNVAGKFLAFSNVVPPFSRFFPPTAVGYTAAAISTRGCLKRTQGMTQKDPLLHKSLIIFILRFERGDSQQVKSAFCTHRLE